MLTFEEIKKLTQYQLEVFKDVFATKEDLQRLEDKFDVMQTTLDNSIKMGKDNDQETKVLGHKTHRLEKWAIKAPRK